VGHVATPKKRKKINQNINREMLSRCLALLGSDKRTKALDKR